MLDPAIRLTFDTCVDAVRRGDTAAFERCFRDDAEGFTTLVGEVKGPAGFKGALQNLTQRLPDLQLEPLRTYGEGPEMAARMRIRLAGKEAEGIFAFRFGPDHLIERLLILWDPSTLLKVQTPRLGAGTKAAVEAYFKTYNENDVEAHMALMSSHLVYFGAVSRITAEDHETTRGIFRSAHERMGLKRFDIIRVIGREPHLAVLVRMHGRGPGGPTDEGVWVFRMDPDHRFNRVSVLWNPGTFLTWDHRV